jgi:hypothetical protein
MNFEHTTYSEARVPNKVKDGDLPTDQITVDLFVAASLLPPIATSVQPRTKARRSGPESIRTAEGLRDTLTFGYCLIDSAAPLEKHIPRPFCPSPAQGNPLKLGLVLQFLIASELRYAETKR